MSNTKKNKFGMVYEQLEKYNNISASQLSLKLKTLTSHQVAGILSVLHKHGVVDRNYNDRYACIIWKTKNLNSSYIINILERLGGNKMTENKDVSKVLYKGEFIPVEDYESKTKVESKPVGKLAQERWIPLLKFLDGQGEPIPLRKIIAAVGPKVANSVYTLRNKGYLLLIHRKYGVTPQGKEYLQNMQAKLEKVQEAPKVAPKAEPKVEAKPISKPVPPSKKKEEPEEIF
jgi:hypothetical protein